MGKWRCRWCSKAIEGESFIELVKSTMEESEPVHAWENISILEKTPMEHELLAQPPSFSYAIIANGSSLSYY